MFFAKEGLPFIIIPMLAGILFFLLGRGWIVPGSTCIVLGLFCAFFFRDPTREMPAGNESVVSPCDGTVMETIQDGDKKIIRTFLSIFNVHIQRSPVSGIVKSVEYKPGKFLPAMNPLAHSVNEQNIMTIEAQDGQYVVSQIAGLIARRIVCWIKAGDHVQKGQKIGLIRFGSQVDLTLPSKREFKVKPGDKTTGGETVVAL